MLRARQRAASHNLARTPVARLPLPLRRGGKARSNLLFVNQTAGRRLLFITGTDTGVGKTLLTSLLLSHLRRRNVPTLAIKPFCSGNRADAQLLRDLQQGDLTLDEINPFFYARPLAPLVAGTQLGGLVKPREVLPHIRSIAGRLPVRRGEHQKERIAPSILLIEGAGGLLVPLAAGYFVLDLIRDLHCEVIVVSRNVLGTLNHTLLTVRALENVQRRERTKEFPRDHTLRLKVVLMQQRRSDLSAASNPDWLLELLAPIPLWKLPFFNGNLRRPETIKEIEKKIEKTLADLVD